MSEEPGDGPPPKSLPQRYSMIVGIAFLALIAYVTLNTISNNKPGVLGVDNSDAGQPLVEFAVPDIRGPVDGDANIFQDDCSSSANPCPETDRRAPACKIKLSGVIRVCDYFSKPLAISFWFTKGGNCLPSQDEFDRLSKQFPEVNFLSIDVRDDRSTVAKIVKEHGWDVPVGWDRDGAVSNLYRVGVCPSVALAYPGGILRGGLIGSDELDRKNLSTSLRELIAESKQRAETIR